MQWKRIQLNAWFTGLKGKRRSSTLAFWLSLSCLAVLLALPCSSFAGDDLEPLSVNVESLTPDQFDELASFSVALRAASSSGNITNDVAAILNLLLEVRNQSQSYIPRLVSYPTAYLNSNASLGQLLNNLLSERGVTGSMPSANQSYLYQIRERLNTLALADPSWTNKLSDLVDLVTNVDLSTYGTARDVSSMAMDLSSVLLYLQDLDYNSADLHYLYPIYTNQVAFADWIGTFEYGHGSQWGVHVDDTQWGELLSGLFSVSNVVGEQYTGLNDKWDDFYDVFSGIESYLGSIHYDDLGYYTTDRSVQQDFATLFDLMAGQSNAWSATASDYQTNDSFQASIQYEERQGQDAFEDQQDQDVQDTSDYLDSHEPDYTARFTDNPMTPLVDAVDFSRRMRQDLPDVSDIETSSRVYLFKREWDPEHLLDRGSPSRASGAPITGTRLEDIYFDLSGSDPHVPNRLLSGATRMAAWAWNLAAMLLAYCMFRNFWDWVASWRA